MTLIQTIDYELNDNCFYMMRDDLLPFSFGGNKYRKAKLFFEKIEAKDYDTVITYGSSSSNHCRIIANMAAKKNYKCIIISPEENQKRTSNLTLMELFEAEIVYSKIDDVKNTIDYVIERETNMGYTPYFIQGGGHGNIGTQAYVNAYEEIKEFESTNNVIFDHIFLTSGTGATQAGLICGNILSKDHKQIIGISNARKKPRGKQIVLESVNDYLREKEINSVTLSEVNYIDDYVLNGYGDYNDEIENIIEYMMITNGIPLDPTYTGKGFWGMTEYIKETTINQSNILFIHTGGTPLFFDYLDKKFNQKGNVK